MSEESGVSEDASEGEKHQDLDEKDIQELDSDRDFENTNWFDERPFESIEGSYRFTVTKRVISIAIISIHLACAASRIGLDNVGEDFESWPSKFSNISWLLYIFFIPGTIVLLNRRKAPLSNSDLILILPISLMWVMSVAPMVQILWAILGFSNPIMWWSTSLFSLALSATLFLRYSLRRDSGLSIDISLKNPPAIIPALALSLLLISVAGPLQFNFRQDNTSSMVALLLISIVPTFLTIRDRVGDMIMLYFTALSLLLIPSLSSSNLSGLDIQTEYFFANSVIQDQSIDFSSNFHYSTVISTQGLVPLISLWTGLSLTVVLKVIYPAIFSYCSILLYQSYDRIFNRDVAYFSTLMTLFGVSFYTSMLDVVRQGFAEIFLLSAVLLMCSSDELRMHRNRVFLVPFLVSMTLAHYGINYVLYPVFWSAYFIFISLRIFLPFEFEDQLDLVFRQGSEALDEQGEELPVFSLSQDVLLDEEGLVSLEELQNMARDLNPLLNIYHLITGTVFLIAWHSFSGQGSVIQSVTGYIIGIYNRYEMYGIMGAFTRAQPTQFVASELELFHELTKYLYMAIMLLSIPSIVLALRKKPKRPSRNFLCLAIGSWFFFAIVFLVPNIAIRLNFPRVYHLLAMFVCPYSFKTLSDLVELTDNLRIKINSNTALAVTKSLLCSLLLLSSGLIYQLTDEGHRSYLDPYMDYALFSESEEAGSKWEESFGDEETGFDCRVSDFYRSKLLGKHVRAHIDESERGLSDGKYIFLSGYNLENNQYFTTNAGTADTEYALFQHIEIDSEVLGGTGRASRIFDSGESHWYYTGICLF